MFDFFVFVVCCVFAFVFDCCFVCFVDVVVDTCLLFLLLLLIVVFCVFFVFDDMFSFVCVDVLFLYCGLMFLIFVGCVF